MRHSYFTTCVLFLAVTALASDEYAIPPARLEHWAWKQPARAAVPAVQNVGWPQSPVDSFILSRLEAAGLQPCQPANRQQLIRRVTFDLIGLPPTPAEIEAFVGDTAPDAWARVIERLLASPHYGERWGRHWLDVARFAESNGYEFDEPRPDAWRYRDYVIRTFNEGRPYDRFIREQLAGDELYPDEPDAVVATGFNLLGPDMTDASEQAQRRLNTLNDMTDTTGLAFLGLTIACARCHNHKFEPIPISDYYRLQAFFAPAEFRRDLPVADKDQKAEFARQQAHYQSLSRPVQDALARLEAPYRQRLYDAKLAKLNEDVQAAHRTPGDKRDAKQRELVEKTTRFVTVAAAEVEKALSEPDRAEHTRLQEQLRTFDPHKPRPLPTAMGLRDQTGPPPASFVLERGEPGNLGQEVRPGYPIILLADHKPNPAAISRVNPTTTGRRLALAHWIASRENPLTARVMVNRMWQHHFGRGIVATASDFGLRGEPPTHPELLDWLATEFMEREWDVKHVHRLILLSATYQQAASESQAARARDPENRLFSRMNRRRLEGEVIRDSLLATSGRLNRHMGGPGVFPPVPPAAGINEKIWPVSRNPADHVRRSVYVFARRNLKFPFLEAFDVPDSNLSCPKREQSTTAPQALTLLNATDVLEAARELAADVEREIPGQRERIIHVYRLVLGRPPSGMELGLAEDFLANAPFSEFCRALYNVNEFIYID